MAKFAGSADYTTASATTTFVISAPAVPAPTSVLPTNLTWDTVQGGVDFSYQVSGTALSKDVPVAFYWASGPNFATDVLQQLAYTYKIPSGTGSGTSGPLHLDGSNFTGAPTGTNYLLAVVDPANSLGNFSLQANVDPLQTKLNVQPVYQFTPPWGPELIGRSKEYRIKRKGCALTALDMALNFAGVSTDPGTLNKLVTATPGGYSGQFELNFPTAANSAFAMAGQTSLQWNEKYRYNTDPQTLRDLLTENATPVIVHVTLRDPKRGDSPHFVLVTGIDGDTFWINDPGALRNTTLVAYNNKFYIRGFIFG